MKSKKGFTLIELLVVIAIIGILATLAVVAFGNAQSKARDSKRVSDVRAAISAFAAAATDESALCNSACSAPIAADTRLSQVGICTSCSSGTLVTKYINLGNLTDPSGSASACGAGAAATCDYAVVSGATLGSFTIRYYLEDGGLKTATQFGL